MGDSSPFLITDSITHWREEKMKKVTFYDLFLVFALILNVGTKNIYTSLMLLFAGLLELVDVIPKLVRFFKDGK